MGFRDNNTAVLKKQGAQAKTHKEAKTITKLSESLTYSSPTLTGDRPTL